MDDFFGASRRGLVWSGGRCLRVIAELVGFLCAVEKDADDVFKMVVLGAEVAVCMARQAVSVTLAPDKITV